MRLSLMLHKPVGDKRCLSFGVIRLEIANLFALASDPAGESVLASPLIALVILLAAQGSSGQR